MYKDNFVSISRLDVEYRLFKTKRQGTITNVIVNARLEMITQRTCVHKRIDYIRIMCI